MTSKPKPADEIQSFRVNVAVRPANVPATAVVVSTTRERGYAIPRPK